jgi:hypothetical protein
LTVTLGTTAQTSLTAVKFLPGYNSGVSASDVAAICALIKDDLKVAHPLIPGSFDMSVSRLYIPNRGVLKVLPGDYIGVDATTGWPILVAKNAITSGPWVHT